MIMALAKVLEGWVTVAAVVGDNNVRTPKSHTLLNSDSGCERGRDKRGDDVRLLSVVRPD